MLRFFPLALVLLVAVGCGGEFTTGQVSGTITLDNEPLANALVTFSPKETGDGSAVGIAQGKTDASGKYTLAVTATEETGAVLGNNTVTIAAIGEDDGESDEIDPNAADPIPAHDFSFEVKAGENTADFNLESGGGS